MYNSPIQIRPFCWRSRHISYGRDSVMITISPSKGRCSLDHPRARYGKRQSRIGPIKTERDDDGESEIGRISSAAQLTSSWHKAINFERML